LIDGQWREYYASWPLGKVAPFLHERWSCVMVAREAI
jgi:hypothetical protein